MKLRSLRASICALPKSLSRMLRAPRWRRDPIRSGHKAQPRTVLVTGATGFVGAHLCRRLIERGERVVVLTRDAAKAWDLFGPHVCIVESLDAIAAEQRIDIIVNLAGARILELPWTARRRGELLGSRLRVTNELVALIARLQIKPEVLISASAIGYYGVRGDEEITEAARGRPIFQSHLCQTWELAALGAERYGVRVCRLRFGLVLGTDGGAFPGLSRPARFGMQLVLGSGEQWMSWIHIDDLMSLVDLCIERADLRGAFNATAPQPVRQGEFAALSAARWRRRSLKVRVPARLLQIAMGEMSQLLVEGQKVLPMRARCAGFQFRYADLGSALADLLQRTVPAEMPTQIMYDSNCPVCDMEISRYCRDARRAGLSWRADDVADRPELMLRYGLDTQTARRRVYVLDSEGRMVSGMQAIVLMWSALPGWRVLAWVARLPFIRTVLDLLYDTMLAPLIWNWSRWRRLRALATLSKHPR